MAFSFAAVVFDMDGLMFNTEDIYDLVGKALLERRGLEFNLELKLKMMGRTSPEAYRILVQECGLEDSIETLEQENDELLFALIPQHIQKLPGLDTLLELARSAGAKLGVATSSRSSLAEAKLGHFDLQSHFDEIVTGDMVVHGKPHPEIYLNIAKRLQVRPEEMLVFEDSPAGSKAAVAAGAYTVAVPGKHCRDQDYSHVPLVVDRLDDEAVRRLF